jgi:hypothetical protein
MQGTVRAAVLGTVLAAVLGVSLTACGSSPPSAPAVLKSDGYSTVVNETQATINSSFGSAAPYVTSAVVGEKGSSAIEEIVVGGNTVNGVTGGRFFAGLESQLQQEFPKTTITVSGDILRVITPAISDITGGQS